jgi:cytochrome c1
MSNRPGRKQSRSAPVHAKAKSKAKAGDRSQGRSRRASLVAIAAVGVVVVAALVFAVWMRGDDTAGQPVLDGQAAQGQQVAKDKGCISCHTSDGGRSEGPTWKGLYGKTVTLTNGTQVTADDAYLTQAVRQPDAQIVEGYKPGMPATPVTDDELAALIAYIQALG